MIKLIIFDLDGVVVDTESIHHECLVEAVANVTAFSVKECSYLLKIDGTTTSHKLSLLKDYMGLTDLEMQLIDDKKQQLVIRHFYRPLNSMPDAYTTLSKLKEKYKLAVASNSRKENVLMLLNVLGLTAYFDIILSGSDVNKHKPDPEIFNKIITHLNVLPTETLILEDSPAGKYAAIASNGHLLAIDKISDVTLTNIENAISKYQTNGCSANGGNRV